MYDTRQEENKTQRKPCDRRLITTFFSYLIQNSVKPIVLTGAQKSILQEITDARKNLHDSIRCALDDRSRDVMLVFDGKIIAGTRAKKDGDLQL